MADDGDILDLDTKFAVDITSPDTMHVHVFDGAVEVIDSEGKKRLTRGQGLSIRGSNRRRELVASPDLFVSNVPRGNKLVKPGLHWSFDEGTGQSVHISVSALDVNEATVGTPISEVPNSPGPAWIEGVLEHAQQFDGKGDWVNTGYSGVSGKQYRTVACWVRLPSDWGGSDRGGLISWGLQSNKSRGKAWMLTIRDDQSGHPEGRGGCVSVWVNRRYWERQICATNNGITSQQSVYPVRPAVPQDRVRSAMMFVDSCSNRCSFIQYMDYDAEREATI